MVIFIRAEFCDSPELFTFNKFKVIYITIIYIYIYTVDSA